MIARIMNELARKRAALKNSDEGFTLIELLVVVIIIGILAAVAIPIYIGVQNQATESNIKSDLANAKTAVVAYYTANNALPAAINSTTLSQYGYQISGTETISYSPGPGAPSSGASFCLAAPSTTGSGTTFYATDTLGVVTVLKGGTNKPSNC